MKSKNVAINKTFFLLVLAFFLVLSSYAVYSFVTGGISFSAMDGWDGVTIAEEFHSGNGTEDNPYVIQNAEEFMYFQTLIEGENYISYQDKYYVLGDDIDFNNHNIQPIGVSLTETVGEEEHEIVVNHIFKGHFDGSGYSLRNFKITEPKVFGGKKYYALFPIVEDGSIYRMNLDLYEIDTMEDSDVIASGLVGNIYNGVIEHVRLSHFKINGEKGENVTIGVLAGGSDGESLFRNVYVEGDIHTNHPIHYVVNGKVENFISALEYEGELETYEKSFYEYKVGKYFLGDEEVEIEELLNALNKGLEDPYYWKYDEETFIFYMVKPDEVEEAIALDDFSFSALASPAIEVHTTGVLGTNVYINDLVSDYNYYIGKNYTKINNTTGAIPSGNDQGLYTNNNLATVYIRYSSSDFNDSNIYGTVSKSEGYRDFYYYKRYPVVNGYVEFNLIDNPWGNRPNGRAFNGWVTDYSGAVVSFDSDTYVRSVRIPVSNVSTPISITFYSSWTLATTVTTTGELNNLKTAVMQEIPKVATEDLTNYYILQHVNQNGRYPTSNYLYTLTGTKITSGSYCYTVGGCDYVDKVTVNTYDSDASYYRVTVTNNVATVTRYYPSVRAFSFYTGGVAAGYFMRVSNGTQNIYNASGAKVSYCSGDCYQLMQYSDGAIDNTQTYYYLATRDTNIFAPSGNVNSSNITTTRPMTITGLNNNTDNSARTLYINGDWTFNADIRLEYLTVYSNVTATNVTTIENGTEIYGNYKNVKLGRGLKRNGNYLTASSFIGGSNSGTSGLQKYTLIVESGFYQNGSGVGHTTTQTHYVNANIYLGNDLDRVTNNNNNLIVYYCYAGSWASNLYSRAATGNTYDIPSVSTTIRSGNFGANEGDYAAGVYAGGRNAGTHYSLREVTIEGGHVFNLIGGPISDTGRAKLNDIILNVKGGSVNMVLGGAGASNTVGNRIITVTGGTVQYSVLGGSNAYTTNGGADPEGKIDGDTLIYVGGNAIIGGQTGSLYNISSGNVFGAGNGRQGEWDVGAVNNSNIILGGTATIRGNVYGGGNFGAVGGNTSGANDYVEDEVKEKDVYEDGTVDNNIRYYGANPDNYVTFNGDTYRIIGLFNNVETPDGNKNLVRIMRNASTGNNNWGGANSSEVITEGRNSYYNFYNFFIRQDGATSNMHDYLNSTFYNGLSAASQSYIQTATWHMGALESSNFTAGRFYTSEHGTESVNGDEKTSASFNVGLYYASDYGFASKGNGCLAANLYNYNGDCANANWMSSILTNNAWSLTPSLDYTYTGTSPRFYYGYQEFVVNNGRVTGYAVNNNANFRSAPTYPSFYLKEDVTITGGTGTSDNPYVIGTGEKKLTDVVYKKLYPDADGEGDSRVEDNGKYESATDYQDRTHIQILGGTVQGSVYGAGNNNGAGNLNGEKVAYAKITIDMNSGTINDSIYGGANEQGTVYGDVLMNINNGTINGSIYGGGKGGYTNDNSPGTYVSRDIDINIGAESTSNLRIGKNVYGGSAFGSVNGVSQENAANEKHVRLRVTAGTIVGDVFGGGQGDATHTPYEFGYVFVHINGGNISRVFGGNDTSGQPSNASVVYLNGGTIGNAFGGGNNTGQESTDIRLQGATITGNLYGGSNQSGTVGTSHATSTEGSVTDIYGGNNLAGSTINTNVIFTNGDVKGNIYGGGNQAESNGTNVYILGGILNDVFGGGNQAGVSNSTFVTVLSGTINHLYGGSNKSGVVGDTHIDVVDSFSNRGLNTTVQSNLILDDQGETWFGDGMRYIKITPKIENLSDVDYVEWTAKIIVPGSSIFYGFNYLQVDVIEDNGTYTFTHVNKYDANRPFILKANSITQIPDYFAIQVPVDIPYNLTFELSVTSSTGEKDFFVDHYIDGLKIEDLNKGINYIYGGNNEGGSTNSSSVNITAGTIGEVYGGGNQVGVTSTKITANGGDMLSVFGGSNQKGDVTKSDVNIGTGKDANATIGEVYGGNNAGGITSSANVNMQEGTVSTIYGGGNNADVTTSKVVVGGGVTGNVYGGGNAAKVQQSSTVDVDGGIVAGNLYGGGNEGTVQKDTSVTISGGNIKGNAYAGGNGATAIVHGNSEITIDGSAIIGTEDTIVPNSGCVFGSGNAASTGLNGGSSKATVNIVGGEVFGNVYGGAKMSVVYGTTDMNIGTSAVRKAGLTEGNILIHGTVFGGGESNESGSEVYDYNFISVTNGITVNIDGTGYIDNHHDFIIQGSIFGSGNASSSSGESNINIKNLGSKDKPNQAISIQRATNLVIDSSVIELFGTTDRTNEYSDIVYSLNLIDKMIIKNATTLFLQHNANMLKEFYSGVDTGGKLVKAAVEIDDDNKTVVKNVDNRIYMASGENLHVTVNQSATAYGKVSGMTFFGMYVPIEGGGYRLGLYDPAYTYGDSGSGSLEIVGGSYVIGLRYPDHDITKDGFYTNILDEETYSEIITQYIDPSEIGDDGYRWIVGFETINYEVNLTISKYASMGTGDLSLIDFSKGDTIFEVIGFDVSDLDPSISLIDSNYVPRVADTEEEANSVLGLSMKVETQEWTDTGVTKFLSKNGGEYTGDTYFVTDSKKKSPHLMFYSYHAKNFNREGDLGQAVVMMQVLIPKNAIEYEIKFVTITVIIDAKIFDDEPAYDAAITYDRKYEMPATTDVFITNKSQFTAYYALNEYYNTFTAAYGIGNVNYHALVLSEPLPVGTMITMLDYGSNPNRPDYYYYTITQADYNAAVSEKAIRGEASYRLNKFIRMDSTSGNNTYNDAVANTLYYDNDTHMVDEEFIFIFDFKDTNVVGNHPNIHVTMELRNQDDWFVVNVLSIRDPIMYYSTFESSNAVLQQTITDTDEYLYYNVADEFHYSTNVMYNETENRQPVIDTNYENSKMGLNIEFFNKEGEAVSSSMLVGTNYTLGDQEYYADGNGVFRIKLANKVSTLERDATLVPGPNLPAGEYTIRYTIFASEDGLHNSTYSEDNYQEFNVIVVSANNYIYAECDDDAKLVYGETGLNHAGEKINTYTVKYNSLLANPNFRVEIMKRDTTDVNTLDYESVEFSQLFSNYFDTIGEGNEVKLPVVDSDEQTFDFVLADDLVSGTYRVIFRLYDNNQLIDEDIKYVIVQKKID